MREKRKYSRIMNELNHIEETHDTWRLKSEVKKEVVNIF